MDLKPIETFIQFVSGPTFAVWASGVLDNLPAIITVPILGLKIPLNWHTRSQITKYLVASVITAAGAYVGQVITNNLTAAQIGQLDPVVVGLLATGSAVLAIILHPLTKATKTITVTARGPASATSTVETKTPS